jgi:hypothetical protein
MPEHLGVSGMPGGVAGGVYIRGHVHGITWTSTYAYSIYIFSLSLSLSLSLSFYPVHVKGGGKEKKIFEFESI